MKHAFCRVETVADFADALNVLASGINLAIEPVTGSLAGPARPTEVVFENGRQSSEANVLEDTPAGLGAFFATILRDRSWKRRTICRLVDVRKARRDLLETAISGFCGLLNRRAGQMLSVCDLCDLFDWLVPLFGKAAIDYQLPYGHKSAGWFLKRIGTDVAENEVWRPATSPASRTLVCWVTPDKYDVDAILTVATTSDHSVGLVNGVAASRRVRAFRGASPDKAMLLANHQIAAVHAISLKGTGTRHWNHVQAKSREMTRYADLAVLPDGLQQVWADQHDLHRTWAMLSSTGTEDDRNHAQYSAIKESDDLRSPRSYGVTCDLLIDSDLAPVAALVAQQERLAYAAHNCGGLIVLDAFETPRVSDWLLGNWDTFVGANFKTAVCAPQHP